MRRTLLILPILCVLSGSLLLGLPATGEPPASLSDLSIDQLIQRLGNDDFKVREAAANELKKRPEAMAALRKAALKSTDPEVRRRCEELLRGIRSERQAQLFKRILQDGYADCLCGFTKAEAQEADMAFWECFKELFARIAARANFHDDDESPWWQTHFATQIPSHKLTWSDQWSSTTDVSREAIFADSIKQKGSFAVAKIVCRRDMTIEGENLSGAFLCTGNVKMTCTTNKHRGFLTGALICTGDVEVPKIESALVIAGGRVICDDIRRSIVVQGRSKALGMRFFELSDMGLGVHPHEWQGYLQEVKDGPFARSGFQSRDSIVSINGKTLASVEEFQRVLRQYYVDNVLNPQALPILVERGGKTMVLKFSYP